jgi:hypothetical protein
MNVLTNDLAAGTFLLHLIQGSHEEKEFKSADFCHAASVVVNFMTIAVEPMSLSFRCCYVLSAMVGFGITANYFDYTFISPASVFSSDLLLLALPPSLRSNLLLLALPPLHTILLPEGFFF